MKALTAQVKEREALYDFTGEDQVRHRVWKIGADAEIQEIRGYFRKDSGDLYCGRSSQSGFRSESRTETKGSASGV